jgi:hypothetical protein
MRRDLAEREQLRLEDPGVIGLVVVANPVLDAAKPNELGFGQERLGLDAELVLADGLLVLVEGEAVVGPLPVGQRGLGRQVVWRLKAGLEEAIERLHLLLGRLLDFAVVNLQFGGAGVGRCLAWSIEIVVLVLWPSLKLLGSLALL